MCCVSFIICDLVLLVVVHSVYGTPPCRNNWNGCFINFLDCRPIPICHYQLDDEQFLSLRKVGDNNSRHLSLNRCFTSCRSEYSYIRPNKAIWSLITKTSLFLIVNLRSVGQVDLLIPTKISLTFYSNLTLINFQLRCIQVIKWLLQWVV